MIGNEFDKVVKEQLEYCESLMTRKGEEYSGENPDRLKVFKDAANLQGLTPKQALAGMMAKHTISVYDLIHRDAIGQPSSKERWIEKITDSMNYLILLRGLIEEEDN